jgi:AGCS family alanine or glycine:cation symporter
MAWQRLATLFLLAASPVAAQERGIDERIQDAVKPYTQGFTDLIFSAFQWGDTRVPVILLWLIAVALFCTVYFGFINFRGFRHGFRLLRGDYSDPKSKGDVSHFQALATALSGTVGLGNIAGVALAVKLGGPGATFWMIMAGIFGMASKFCECTLGVKYRRENPDGTVSGGPMYFLRYGIAEEYPKLVPLAKVLGALFAVCCILGTFGAGNMFQANGAMQALVVITGGEQSPMQGMGWAFGLIMAILVGVVIVGGIRSIARVTDKLIPFMIGIYLLAGFFVIFSNFGHVPAAFATILKGAFTPEGMQGGALGVMLVGFQRAAFSNEAGVGSAAIAHSAVRTKHPVTEGHVALWEPFIDTVVVCTMSALVIVISDVVRTEGDLNGVGLMSAAFAHTISWFPYVLAVAVFLFAYSTMISYSYYGEKATTYLFGEKRGVVLTYKVVFLGATVLGTTADFTRLAGFSDAAFFSMAIPNAIGIYLLAHVVKRELKQYRAKLASGEITPTRKPLDGPVPSL